MAVIAKVALEKTTLSFDKLYSYCVPDAIAPTLQPGCRVIVPFGGGNKVRQGIVLELDEGSPDKLKEVSSLIDPVPLLNSELLSLLVMVRRLCFCTYYDVLKTLVPTGISVRVRTVCLLDQKVPLPENLSEGQLQILQRLRSAKKAVDLEKLLQEVYLDKNAPEFQELVESGVLLLSEGVAPKSKESQMNMARLTPAFEEGTLVFPKMTSKQKSVIRLLEETGCASVKEVLYYAGVTHAVIKNLVKMGAVEEFGRQIFRSPYLESDVPLDRSPIELTENQQAAYETLLQDLDSGKFITALLYGVTGSGKTQVFLKLIETVQRQGRGVIVLVPEISLTPQTVDVFRRRFGKRVALLHSGLSMGERADEYRRIQKRQANLVIGTRSAIFAPLPNIGLIVMDEEQEGTYKSGQTPKYHARDIAKIRCRTHNALLLLASATPSIESFYYAKMGKYHLITLKERFQGRSLPPVEVVDLSQYLGSDISPELAAKITQNIHQGEQTILFMNRRGYHTLVKCQACGEVVTCPNCSVALTYHNANGRLMCHYCGYSQKITDSCLICGSSLMRFGGSGTQKIEELLESVFPEARVLRMDMDTTMARFAHEKKFAAFAAGEYDIMVGTQMVAKGHNFPNVTLVGVLNADQSLYSQDFRSAEKTFSLITQVVGRCGRGELPGKAIIQTYTPDNPVIQQAADQDYDSFYNDEMKVRKVSLYPPYCSICVVGFSGKMQSHVQQAAKDFSCRFREVATKEHTSLPIRMLEPCEASVEKIAGKYRYHLLIKYRQSNEFLDFMWDMLTWYEKDTTKKDVYATADLYYDGSS